MFLVLSGKVRQGVCLTHNWLTASVNICCGGRAGFGCSWMWYSAALCPLVLVVGASTVVSCVVCSCDRTEIRSLQKPRRRKEYLAQVTCNFPFGYGRRPTPNAEEGVHGEVW